jgi:hypothetical protein
MNVHTLVAEAFIGERPADQEVDHRDGNCLDNNVSNLRYVTRSQNQRNRNSYHERVAEYVPLPEGAILVEHFKGFEYANLYYHDSSFYMDTGQRDTYRRLNPVMDAGKGYYYVNVLDTQKQHHKLSIGAYRRFIGEIV